MIIKIRNFDKYNPRKDLKRMPWFRVDSNFFDTPEFYDACALTRNLFITLLGLCAQKVNEAISHDIKYISTKSAMTQTQIMKSLEFLQEKQVLEYSTNELERTRTDSIGNVPNITEHNITEQDSTSGKTRTHTNSLANEILDMYNAGAPDNNMPQVKKLNLTRRKKLQSAIKDFSDLEDWRKIFNVAALKFFTGKDGKVFTPSWDYIFRNDNYIKFFEEYELEFKHKKKPTVSDEEFKKILMGG